VTFGCEFCGSRPPCPTRPQALSSISSRGGLGRVPPGQGRAAGLLGAKQRAGLVCLTAFGFEPFAVALENSPARNQVGRCVMG